MHEETPVVETSDHLFNILERSGQVFSTAERLGQALQKEMASGTEIFDEAVWNHFAARYCRLRDLVLQLRDLAENPPDGCESVARVLMEAFEICQRIEAAIVVRISSDSQYELLRQLRAIYQNGWKAIKDVVRMRGLPEPPELPLEIPPRQTQGRDEHRQATPADHLALLEDLRDSVHFVAEARRHQFDRGYSNDLLRNMVSSIQWKEAAASLDVLDFATVECRESVRAVLRRQLSAGTIVQVDDLLQSVIAALRNEYESHELKVGGLVVSRTPVDRKRKRSSSKGEGRAKLIAALTSHHRYADGGCLNCQPIKNNALAEMADVARSTASAFFEEMFGGHAKYRATCADLHVLKASLKMLNGEFTPKILLQRTGLEPFESDTDE